jgi:hypothetical protein
MILILWVLCSKIANIFTYNRNPKSVQSFTVCHCWSMLVTQVVVTWQIITVHIVWSLRNWDEWYPFGMQGKNLHRMEKQTNAFTDMWQWYVKENNNVQHILVDLAICPKKTNKDFFLMPHAALSVRINNFKQKIDKIHGIVIRYKMILWKKFWVLKC